MTVHLTTNLTLLEPCFKHLCWIDACIMHCAKAYWASEASPTWAIHLGFFIYYYYILSYVRRGLCDPPFFFLQRALCAVQSSCTVLFRCARPTHALHASSNIVYAPLGSACFRSIDMVYVRMYVRTPGMLLDVSCDAVQVSCPHVTRELAPGVEGLPGHTHS